MRRTSGYWTASGAASWPAHLIYGYVVFRKFKEYALSSVRRPLLERTLLFVVSLGPDGGALAARWLGKIERRVCMRLVLVVGMLV